VIFLVAAYDCTGSFTSTVFRSFTTKWRFIAGRIILLVGGLEHGFYDFPETVGNVIIPTDFHSIIFQRGWAQPPTSFEMGVQHATFDFRRVSLSIGSMFAGLFTRITWFLGESCNMGKLFSNHVGIPCSA